MTGLAAAVSTLNANLEGRDFSLSEVFTQSADDVDRVHLACLIGIIAQIYVVPTAEVKVTR